MSFFFKKIIHILFLNFIFLSICFSNNNLISIPNQNTNLVKKAQYLKPVPANKNIKFTIWLKFRNENQLKQEISDIYNPTSEKYQQFLDNIAFAQQYAPEKNIEYKINDFFKTHGLNAVIKNHNIVVTGPANLVGNVLHTSFNYYHYKNKLVYANSSEPQLPAEIAENIDAISGLSNAAYFKPTALKLPDELQIGLTALATPNSFNGFSAANLRKTYRLNNNININGSGQTIIITDGCGFYTPAQIMADANVFSQDNGLPLLSSANFAVLNSNLNPFTSCTQSPTGWEGEIALDVQAAHAIAPNANIVLVLTSANGDFISMLSNIINKLTNSNFTIAGFSNARIISNSWGADEFPGFNVESLFQQAAASGINLNFATGDCGDETYNSGACQASSNTPVVEYPASSAYVTAMGGTTMFVDNNWNYAFETVWGTYYQNNFYFGGGGGVSKIFALPSWQTPIKNFTAGGYGVIDKRAIPDISMLGDPVTGFIIYNSGAWQQYGGTSLSTPLFAGTLALVNQARMLKNKNPIGFAAPYFYTYPNTFARNQGLNLIEPPHQIFSGVTKPPAGAPLSAFSYSGITFGWNSSLRIEPMTQFWNDAVGVGSPNIPQFIMTMSNF